VGAGLAGLAAGIELGRAGHEVAIYEAGDGPGGRVRTDVVDGFRLDRGFQILLEAYPECRALLDYDRLDLQRFRPGALVRVEGSFRRLGDPLREPAQLWSTVTSPVGTLQDKLRILAFRLNVSRGSVDDLWRGVGTTAIDRFERLGFSEQMIERFLRPLFAGITLDPELQGSSQVVNFVFRMLSAGDAAVPARGMGAISDLMAEMLPPDSLHLGARVAATTATSISIEGGREERFDAVIVATDASEAARLLGTPDPGWNGVTSVWFEADEPPIDDAVLVLNGEGRGPINSMAPMSAVSADYAPAGSHSFVVSAPSLDPDLPDAFRAQLREWFGARADAYRTLRVDRIERAQPRQLPGHDARAGETVGGRFVAGDHRRDASLNGAIGSGRAVATAVMSGR
jgi:phytoene dehydrogenase-like protein